VCTFQELLQGIPLVNVWRGRQRLQVGLEIESMTTACFVLLITFHLVPYSGLCETHDICTCGFAKNLPPLVAWCSQVACNATAAAGACAVADVTQAQCMSALGRCG